MACGCQKKKRKIPPKLSVLNGIKGIAKAQIGVDAVSRQVRNCRVEVCHHCPYLVYGTFCGVCGCLVKLKARIRSEECVSKEGNKWNGCG